MRKDKINRIRFGQILTNQVNPFKRKTIKKGPETMASGQGKSPSKTARFWLSVAPVLIKKNRVRTVQILPEPDKGQQKM
ncbi:MAG: hypothetical protein HFI33_06315 [Lachnospiraceae bacterium]|nr:hypothetical protein [Lachnospiraceae bacterium]